MLFLEGNVLDCLHSLPDQSIHCVVTSPPYYGLRAYGTNPQIWGGDSLCDHEWIDSTYIRNNDQTAGEKRRTNVGAIGRDIPVQNAFCSKCGAWLGELGLEPTPDLYVEHLVMVFREVKRVLRDDGTLWLNLGDSYAGSGKGPTGHNGIGNQEKRQGFHSPQVKIPNGLKPKDLVGIPWRVAFALQQDGWYLRSDIIWAKPNPMPESVTDRPTRSHEYVFLLTKSQRYFYDHIAIQEDCVNGDPTSPRGSKGVMGSPNEGLRKQDALGKRTYTGFNDRYEPLLKRNRRDTWVIPTQAFPGSHFAVFPESLVEPCIKAGTSEYGCCPKCGAPFERVIEKERIAPAMPSGNREINRWSGGSGQVSGRTIDHDLGWQPTCSCGLDPVPCLTLDPFGGSGTVAKVSRDLGRDSVYCDLNPDYVRMAMDRVGSSLFSNIEYRKIGTTVPGER